MPSVASATKPRNSTSNAPLEVVATAARSHTATGTSGVSGQSPSECGASLGRAGRVTATCCTLGRHGPLSINPYRLGMEVVAAVCFTPAPQEQNPNLRVRGRHSALETYYKGIVVTLASLARHNPNFSLLCITDSPPPPAYSLALASVGAKVELLEFTHRPPPGFYPTFNASIYTVDALTYLARSNPDSMVMLLDPDVLCTGPVVGLYQYIQEGQLGALDIRLPIDEASQGLSALQAQELHRLLDPRLSGLPVHYGGECYAGRGRDWLPVLSRAESAWAFSLDRFQSYADAPRLVTEEHLFNFALRDSDVRDLSPYIRRIWTAPTFRNVRADDYRLPLWHLPSEKDRGIIALYEAALDRRGWFWTEPEECLRNRLRKRMGLGRRRAGRFAYDTTARVARMVQRRLQRR